MTDTRRPGSYPAKVEEAADVLEHYFCACDPKFNDSYDCRQEIRGIAYLIFDAAVEQVRRENANK